MAALDAERKAFFARLDEKDRRVIGEFNRDTSEYVFRLNGDPPEPRLGLIVGEFGHHLRAALDNLLWQLVLLRGGSPTWETQFPIYESRKRYEREWWRVRRMLRGVSADDRALIEDCQPFQLGDNAPNSYLARLQWLNNVDKHRFVHVGGATPDIVAITVSFGEEGEFAGYFPWYPVNVRDVGKFLKPVYSMAREDRTELARFPIEPSGSSPYMEMHPGATIEIVLSDAETLPFLMLHDLVRIRNVVKSIIDALRPRWEP